MRFHFAAVPVHDSGAAENELNHFLASHRVMAVDRQLVADGARSAWAVCVSYVDSSCAAPATVGGHAGTKKQIDYREVLPPADFAVYAKLRDLRKVLAQRDGVPPYSVLTNEQIAALVQRAARTVADFGAIDGIGPAKVDKYAPAFLAILCPSAPAQEQS